MACLGVWRIVGSAVALLALSAVAPASAPGKTVVIRAVMVENEDPFAAGKEAAEKLQAAMAGTPLKAVIVSECYEDRPAKNKLLDGITSVLAKELVHGAATYGSFTQDGCTDFDAVCLLGLGGDGLEVSAHLVTEMGTARLVVDTETELIAQRLHKAGSELASGLRRTDRDRLLVLLADAHSPKNQFLVEGVQRVLGAAFPITGGCANKNAGQTFVYYQGKMYEDSAVGLMLAGDFRVSLAGRQANVNELVISSARDGAKQALGALAGKPIAALAFNCAGRRSKLKKYEDELGAMQEALGQQLELFGCYCAGEMGPLDDPQNPSQAVYGGSGWYVMFAILYEG